MEDANTLYPGIIDGAEASLGTEQAELIANLLENVTTDKTEEKEKKDQQEILQGNEQKHLEVYSKYIESMYDKMSNP